MKLPGLFRSPWIRSRWRELIAALLLLLPPLLLMLFGAVWLWQEGQALWFFAACLLGAMPAALILLRWHRATSAPDPAALVEVEADWPGRERAAFEKVRHFAETAAPLSLQDRDEALTLARRTVETVAVHYRAEASNPLAAFTLPEGLLLVHRVSARLRRAVLDMVPLSDRLTLSQLAATHETIGKAAPLIALGQDIYDLYRVLRPAINPAGAALGEARRLIFDAAWDRGKERLQRKLTQLLVLEVGKAAIELYSGRLKHDEAELSRIAASTAASGVASGETEPLRILIAGQINAGKSSLLNALTRDILAPVSPLPGPPGFRCFAAKDPDGRDFVFVDAPGLDIAPAAIAALAEEARKADIVLWTTAAHQPARQADASGLKAFREWFAARPEFNRPPVLCVATHIDQLRPFAEWIPPYDIVAAERPKARAIRDAVQAIAHDLDLTPDSIVPVCLAPTCDAYNLDALRARIAAALPEARYAQLARAHAAPGDRSWWKEMGRVMQAGRMLLAGASSSRT
jgi:predicted GTPase